MVRGVLMMVAVGAVGMTQTAQAQSDWGVVLNGHAVHVNAEKHWNEDNWGLGFEKEFNSSSHWVAAAVANGFKDSMDNPSYMAGASLKRRFRMFSDHLYFDAGIVAFYMTRHDVRHNEPFPGVLPAVTFGSRRIAVNVTYMPGSVVDDVTHADKIDPAMQGVFFIQLKLDASLFGLGAHRASGTFAQAAE
jgi:antimicrobial peptide resistance and lipid A acylation protein PagP